MKIILAREEVSPIKADNHGQTPLMFAASQGIRSVVALLQPYEEVVRKTFWGLGGTTLLKLLAFLSFGPGCLWSFP